MSTVPEVIAARHMGADVLGISLVTNLAAGISPEPLSHDEVAAAGAEAALRFGSLLDELLPTL
jgi:purine-nucleoside phosphorylase